MLPLRLHLPPIRSPWQNRPAVVEPEPLSLFDPIHLGADAWGLPASLTLAYRNLLLGGEPGAGKSNAAAQVVAHACLCPDVRLWLFDGKRVELGLFRPLAERFVGPNLPDAIDTLRMLGTRLDERYEWLDATGRRKLTPAESAGWDLVVVDELVLFTATYGTAAEQKEFSALLRDVVGRGRAACMPVLASALRPSSEVVPTSLRDLFAYRWAFRATTGDSSDVVLGNGWATRGYDSSTIDPEAHGVGYLRAEGGTPRRVKASYLTDDHIATIVTAGLHLRSGLTVAGAR